jgi:type II secretory pathway component PulF
MQDFFSWLLAPLWAILHGRAESTRRGTLLWTLAVAVEKQFPLVPFLESLADEAGGRWRWRVRGLAELISAGTSIPDALEAMPGILPEDTVAMIRVGAQTGNMVGALREEARLARRRGEEPATHAQGTLLYLATIVLTMSCLATFIVIFIIPKYKAIFAGFEVKLPALTEMMIRFCDSFSSYWFLVFPMLPLVILGLCAFASLGVELMGLGPAWGRTRWLSSHFWPRLRSPHLLRCLSVAVEGGRPLSLALELLAEQHPDAGFRLHVAEISSEVERGENCWLVLRAANLLRKGEPTLLEAAERVGNLTWALRGMADGIERRSEYRYQFIAEFIDPALVVCMGSVVGAFCLSLFMPLIELLNKLS